MRLVFFFFQAEDGIRDGHVTGVQTCALPILSQREGRAAPRRPRAPFSHRISSVLRRPAVASAAQSTSAPARRSEERRVGKEGRGGRAREQGREERTHTRDDETGGCRAE